MDPRTRVSSKGYKILFMAARPNFPEIKKPEASPTDLQASRDEVREVAAKFYAAGFERMKIARIMIDHLVPNGKDRPFEQRLSQARHKLTRWEREPKFRDLVWKHGLIKLDLSSGKIMEGLAKNAKKGKVDAARLAFELTGRHDPKGEAAPPSVVIAIGNGIPRPIKNHADVPQLDPNNVDMVIDMDEEEED